MVLSRWNWYVCVFSQKGRQYTVKHLTANALPIVEEGHLAPRRLGLAAECRDEPVERVSDEHDLIEAVDGGRGVVHGADAAEGVVGRQVKGGVIFPQGGVQGDVRDVQEEPGGYS